MPTHRQTSKGWIKFYDHVITRIDNKQGLFDTPRKVEDSKKTDFQLFMMQTINEPLRGKTNNVIFEQV